MKKKLSLHLDQLSVESFHTSTAPLPRGTVRGFDITASTCYDEGCGCISDTCNTNCEQNTCGGSCGIACPPTYHGEHSCAPPTCFNSCICP